MDGLAKMDELDTVEEEEVIIFKVCLCQVYVAI